MIASHEMRTQANGNEVHRFPGLLSKATAHRGTSHNLSSIVDQNIEATMFRLHACELGATASSSV
jgi:hypothetical protein